MSTTKEVLEILGLKVGDEVESTVSHFCFKHFRLTCFNFFLMTFKN